MDGSTNTPSPAAAAILGNPDGGQPGAPTGTPALQPTPAAPKFAEIFKADPETLGWAEKKNFKDPADVLVGYRKLEQLLGGEKVPVPKDGDATAWDLFYKAGGRPDAPDGYGLSKKEGVDTEFATYLEGELHKVGASVTQAEKIAEALTGYGVKAAERAEQQMAEKSQVELQTLQREWGPGFELKRQAAAKAAQAFGITGEDMGAIERAMGTRRMLEHLSSIGERLGEAPMHTGNQRPAPVATPDAARARREELKSDKAWVARYTSGDARARAEMENLNRIIAGA